MALIIHPRVTAATVLSTGTLSVTGTGQLHLDPNTTGQDAKTTYALQDSDKFVMGIDESTSNDDFVLSRGGSLGTNNAISVDGSDGAITVGSLTIDNIIVNGTTIGHTSDTDLITLASGGVTVLGTISVGVNDTGHDVKFYGATAGKYMLWDESADTLQVEGKFTAIGGSEVSNTLVDTYADFLFNDAEARVQIFANDNGSNASAIILTNVVGANDNNSWVVAHKGPSANNDFRLAYRESTSSEDIVANASNRFAITTAGAVTAYGTFESTISGANTLTVTSTANDAYLALNSDTDEGQDSEILFQAGGTTKGRIEYDHHGTASTQNMYFYVADNANAIMRLRDDRGYFLKDLEMNYTGAAQDSMIVWDGNEGDWYIALDDSNNTFTIGEGSTVGSNARYRIFDSSDYYYAHYMQHSFISDGSSDKAVGLAVGMRITGHADDSSFLAHMAVGEDIGNGDVQVHGDVTNVATLHLSEPDITVHSGTVTNASTLYIQNGPNEGTNDYAIFVDSAYLNRFDGGMQIGGDVTLDSDGAWIYMKGGGTSTNATGIAWTFNTADTRYSEIQMDYDTRASVGFLIHSGYPITIDATTQINYDISGTTYAEQKATMFRTYTDIFISGSAPRIVIGDGEAEDTAVVWDGHVKDYYMALDDSADALVIGEGYTVGTTKRLTINPTGSHYWGISTYGDYTSSGNSSVAVGFAFETAVTAVAGDTSYQAHVIAGSNTYGSLTTQNNSETIGVASTFYINEPDITKGNDTITNAATVYIAGYPSEGTNNYALLVNAGVTKLSGGLNVTGNTYWNSGDMYDVGNAAQEWTDGHLIVLDSSSWAEVGAKSNRTVAVNQLQANWYSYNNNQFIGAVKMMTDYAATDRGRLVFRIGDDTNGNTDLMEVGKEGFYKRARNAERDMIHEMVIEAYAAGSTTWVNLGLAIPSTSTDVWTRGIAELKVMGHTSSIGNGATIQTWYFDMNDSNATEETIASISTTNSGDAPEARLVISSGNFYAQIRPNQGAGFGAFYGMAVVKFYLPRGAGNAGDSFTWNTNNSMIN